MDNFSFSFYDFLFLFILDIYELYGNRYLEKIKTYYLKNYVLLLYIYMKNKQNYLFPVIATGKIGSSPMDCEDVCSLITSSSKYCSLYVIFI